MQDLLSHFKNANPEIYPRLTQALEEFHLYLVVNMVKSKADLKYPEIISSVCRDFLLVQPDILEAVPFDFSVDATISQMVPFSLPQKKSKVMKGLNQIAISLMHESRKIINF